jgi:hypothetical protein
MRKKKSLAGIVYLGVALFLSGFLAVSGCASPAAAPTTTVAATTTPATMSATNIKPAMTTPAATPSTAQARTFSSTDMVVTIDLAVYKMAYNLSTIIVPAGANVTIRLNNEDESIYHGFSLYTDKTATTIIFRGKPCWGIYEPNPVYKFTAPTKPGTYFFQDDVSVGMTGDFIVK